MTIKELYRHFLSELKKIYSENEASHITNMIFTEMANISRSTLLIASDDIMDSSTIELLLNALGDLMKNKPVQYVLGFSWFYHLKFIVNTDVLIPRPETEELVEQIIGYLKLESRKKNILEIGSGSGCIPIAIKKNVPHCDITSIDKSEKAIQTATLNAAENQTAITFLNIDFLDELRWESLAQYDLIVSNPPYIPAIELDQMEHNVTKHEPHLALFVPNDDPLIFYKAILNCCEKHLRINGKVFMETHENYANDVANLFAEKGYQVEIKKDIFDKNRMVLASRCH